MENNSSFSTLLGQILSDKDLPVTNGIDENWIENQIKKRIPSIDFSDNFRKELVSDINYYGNQMTEDYEDLQSWKKRGETTGHWLNSHLKNYIFQTDSKKEQIENFENSLVNSVNSNLLDYPENQEKINFIHEDSNLDENNSAQLEDRLDAITVMHVINPFLSIAKNNQDDLRNDFENIIIQNGSEALFPNKREDCSKILATALTIDAIRKCLKPDEESQSLNTIIDKTDIVKKIKDIAKTSFGDNVVLQNVPNITKEQFTATAAFTAHSVTTLLNISKEIGEEINEDKDIGDMLINSGAEYAQRAADGLIDSAASATTSIVKRQCEKYGAAIGTKIGLAISAYIPAAAPLVPVFTAAGAYCGKTIGYGAKIVIDKVKNVAKDFTHKTINYAKEGVRSLYKTGKTMVKSAVSKVKNFASRAWNALTSWF